MTDKLSGYSTTPASNNAASPDGWPEGMTAGSVNNSDREFAARVREFYEDSQWIDYGHTIVSSTGSTIKLSTDVTSIYTAGRAIRINQDASMDGWVTASAYSAPDTSITVTGFTIAAPTQVEVGAIKDHAPLPNNLSITVASLAVTGALNVTGTLTASNISFSSAVISTLTVTEILNSGGDPFTRALNIDAKTSGSAAAWAWPTGLPAIRITVVGGGGAGGAGGSGTAGGGGGGGGGGATCVKRIDYVSGVNNATYTVGAAGAASTVTYNGVVYTGGAGSAGVAGGASSAGAGGAGGTATNGDINISGGSGSPGIWVGAGGTGNTGGCGGQTVQYGNGGAAGAYNGNGGAGTGYGGGGGGGGGNTSSGGAGASGIVIFEY